MPTTRMEILAGFMTLGTSTTQTTRSRQPPLTQRTQDLTIQLASPPRSVSRFLKYANLDIIMPEGMRKDKTKACGITRASSSKN